jgi:CheY-like chemotaxis protein
MNSRHSEASTWTVAAWSTRRLSPSSSTTIASTVISARYALPSSRPDIIILDISMPVMDGCELAQRIRADDHLSKMPLVAVTAFGSGWQQAALACGCTSVLERPTDLPVFERAVRAALGGQSSRLVALRPE